MKQYFYKLAVIWADDSYEGKFIPSTKRYYDWTIEIVKRSDFVEVFQFLPRCWIVERIFAWFENDRLLAKD